MKRLLPLISIALIAIGLISFITVSHIKSIRRLNEVANDVSGFQPVSYLDLNDKKVMEDVLRKIRHYESIEGDPIKRLNVEEIEEEKKKQNVRSLAENQFEDVGLIDINKDPYYYISRWIGATSRQFTSKIITYPYAFDYIYKVNQDGEEMETTKSFDHGAFIALNSTELISYNNIGLKTNGTFSTKKAKAVYGGDIAILSIEYDREDYKEETFQDGVDWSTFLYSYWGKSTVETYEKFLTSKATDPSKTYVTRINETDVKNGALLNGVFPRFGILIIPDYKLGTDGIIKSKLGEAGKNNIINFFNKGGKIFVGGKSGTLLEDFKLMASGVYNRTQLLSINNANRLAKVKGCEDTHKKAFSEEVDDFDKMMVCSAIFSYSRYCLASTFKSIKQDSSYTRLIDIDPDTPQLVTTDVNDGLTYNLTGEDKTYNPLVLFKKNAKNGQIFVMNFNPVHSGGDRNLLTNLIVTALSKDLIMSSKVNMNNENDTPDMPIPAGEFGFQLDINTQIHNLNNKIMNQTKLYVFLPRNFSWVKTTGCTKKAYTPGDIPASIRQGISVYNDKNNKNEYLVCDLNTIAAYSKKNIQLSVKILNSDATKMQYQVLILEPFLTYLDTKGQENVYFDYIKINCQAAPLLRGAINPDPSSDYPLRGRGCYFDNVLKVENKEESPAYDVEYYGLIPLVSPIVDGVDQSVTTWSTKIYVEYYNGNNFQVPLTSLDAYDYVYPSELQGKAVIMAQNWDSPVFPTKETYSKDNRNGLGEIVDIEGINNGLATINSTSEVIKQLNYRISDRFYKLASQRLMAFIDDTTPEGALALYHNEIPSDLLDPVFKDRAKKDFLFSRVDIFFYKNINYYYPPGVSEKLVMSIDKYEKYQKNKNGCAKSLGAARSVRKGGFFTNLEEDKRHKILEPTLWTNELFEYCDIDVIDPTQEGQIGEYFGEDAGNIRLVHYIIPNVEKNITDPGQLLGFKRESAYRGYHENYTSIQFIYLHSLTFIVKSEYCKYGGRIIINLGSKKLKSLDDVTISPDHISVYRKEYNDPTITIYFKRGLMSNEQFGKDAVIIVNIENLDSHAAENFEVTLEDMNFDLSYPPEYERYKKIYTEKKTFEYITAFSLPAVEIKSTLNRTLNGYETLEPFNRIGCYFQELGHREVYGYGETHHERIPGVQSVHFTLSVLSNLGTSSIPFIEYMTVGAGQVIPAGTTTSRVSWKDIWGRTWHQPLRSVFPDIPVIPPPVKNFMMTTTFELLQGNKQIYEWPSDENVRIHLHVKLLNNYPKYFEITRCKENRIRFTPYKVLEFHSREYENKSLDNLTETELNGDNMFLREGGMSSYGVCFQNYDAYVSGNKVDEELYAKIGRARLCADHTDAQEIKKCAIELEDIKTVSRSSQTWNTEKDGKWNYSPLVEKYYPVGYIDEADMWTLTHIDYYDDPMDKAYKYHPDNLLPNYDNDILKPHNTIAIPLYKGLGFNIVYDKNEKMNYHGATKQGWWGDNLQNKDDTLLVGQEVCNPISVNKKSQIKWVDGSQLQGSKRKGSEEAVKKIVAERQKNLYVCLFNRKRPQYPLNSERKYHAANVVENNIVPVFVDLDKNDKRLDHFVCNVTQYDENNLYTLDGNYLETPTSKDYLYFAANLRAHAKESFNILLSLQKFDKIKYDGMVKVNEGGRFVYWNPVNGPNSFLIVDNPISSVMGKRNDIMIQSQVFPRKIATFNSVVYYVYSFKDNERINQVWPYNDFYTNSYGFGDVSITVNVGGVLKTKPTIEPGDTTIAKIIFYNNCGFDWNMLGNAIEFVYTGSEPINAYDLLKRNVHAIIVPTKYNFLKYTVEKEYAKYITIVPSDHNKGVAPEFFDFQNINVVTIRDGFKGEYCLKITVSKDFPDNLRGKPIEIQIEVNKEYFDHFPGASTDPIGSYHNYNVTVPSLYIAVPFRTGDFAGKVLYSSARATNLNIELDTPVDMKIESVKFITPELIEKMLNASLEQDYVVKINSLYDTLKNEKEIAFTESKLDLEKKRVTLVGLKDKFDYFPKKTINQPDIAEGYVILKSTLSQIKQGYTTPMTRIVMKYSDWTNKTKNYWSNNPYFQVEGPWLTLTYSRKLVEYISDGVYLDKVDQTLTPEDSGTMKVQFKLTNSGNGPSYNTKYEIVIQPGLVYVGEKTGANRITSRKNSEGQTILTFDFGAPILAGELKGGIIYLNYSKICDDYEILTQEERDNLPKELPIAQESLVHMDLTNSTGGSNATQVLRQPLSFAYTVKKKTNVFVDMTVSGRRSNPTVTIEPKVEYHMEDNQDNIQLYIGKVDATQYDEKLRTLASLDNDLKFTPLHPKGAYVEELEDKPIQKDPEYKEHEVIYTVVVYTKDGLVSSTQIRYSQKNIGLSTAEVVLIILSILFYLAAAFFIWRGYVNYKQTSASKIEDTVKRGTLDRILA